MKIGIVTHYYKSINYGGNLQAYALCKYLNNFGHTAEQISYDKELKKSFADNVKFTAKKIVKNGLSFLKEPESALNLKAKANIKKRNSAILRFNNKIPHSQTYNAKTLKSITDQYDVLITGSDQVWHPFAVCDAYLLKFGSEKTKRISYAASVATNVLGEEITKRYKNALSTFSAISVREESAIDLIQPIAPIKVEHVIDPTLLLDKNEWEEIATYKKIEEEYVFCYFLGDSVKQRNIVKEFALKNKIKIVSLPYLQGKFRKCDKNFADENLYDVSPEELLGLIKNAKYIFTDSFHATVFSILFKKEFFVFERQDVKAMESRILSLLKMFSLQERLCNKEEKLSVEYITSAKSIDYDNPFAEFELMKQNSKEFLEKNLR